MHANRWERIEQLCQEALEMPEQQQAVFLESACGTDKELRCEVESLLVHRQRAQDFIEAPAMDLAARMLAAEHHSVTAETSRRIGRFISHYRIVEKVASGGMGEVYRAVRADGTYEKLVAIKLIQGAWSTDFFLSRFQNERQILADLDHPNIARLLDGGTTEEGLPFVVMEYIQGLPIDEFCAQKSLIVRERLELFRMVCSAVQYAHQNLVVHRDLKPSNILVTEEGTPKLLDFGIAKILNPRGGEENLQQTVTLLRLLTPDYASPEQVRNEPISTASDVYSLGVILYALLTGQSPYRVSTDSPQEMMKAICDTEPEKPSAAAIVRRVAETASQETHSLPRSYPRLMEENLEKLRKMLAGDLDNIVLKALRKEPGRRYASVDQFSEDIRRYLMGLPVLAHKDTLSYRGSKFIGRHKLGVTAVILLILSLAGGLTATLWQAGIAHANQLRAEQRFNDLRKLANSLVFDLHDAVQDLPGSTTARHLIVSSALEYLDRLSADAGDDLTLKRELATAYLKLGTIQGNGITGNLGDRKAARQSYLKAVSNLEWVTKSLNDFDVQRQLATAYGRVGDVTNDPASLEYYKKSLDIREKLIAVLPNDAKLAGELARSYQEIASVMITSRSFQGAKQASQKSLTAAQRYYDANPHGRDEAETLATSYTKLANSEELLGDYDAALAADARALELDRQLVSGNPYSPNLQRNLAIDFVNIGRVKMSRKYKNKDALSALAHFRSAIAIYEKINQADPADKRTSYLLALSHEYAGSALLEAKTYGSALKEYRTALRICQCGSEWDTKNDRPARLAGNIYKKVADAYRALAWRSKASSSNGFFLSACTNYHNSIAAFDFLQSTGSSTAFDRETQREASIQMAQCVAESPARPSKR